MKYELKIKKDAEKDILALPKADRKKIVEKIYKLSTEPRPHGAEKLKGEEGYRIRQGDYRVIYLLDDHAHKIQIMKVGHRREVYRS